MTEKYYPWGGEFTACNPEASIAVVLLNITYTPVDTIAIYGYLKTENIGIEKIVANVISNPNIRYLIVAGKDIRGHRSGKSLIALHKNGIDKNHKIIDAPGAIPYIENLDEKAISRFRDQIEIIDLLDITDKKTLDATIEKYLSQKTVSYGEPYIAIKIEPQTTVALDDKRALHSRIVLNYMGKITKRGN